MMGVRWDSENDYKALNIKLKIENIKYYLINLSANKGGSGQLVGSCAVGYNIWCRNMFCNIIPSIKFLLCF